MLRAYLRAHFHSFASVSIRGLSVLAGFAVSFFIGNMFGPIATGQYALVTQTGIFLSIVAVGGMDMAVVRRFSATLVRHVPLARSALSKVLAYSIGAGLIISVLLILGGTPLYGRMFGEHLPENAVVLTCIVLLARATLRLTAAVLRSQNAHIVAQTIEVLVIPLTVAVLIASGLLVSLQEILWATALTGITAGVFGIARAYAFTSSAANTVTVTMRDMFRTSLPLWLTGISLNVADWYGLATAASVLGVYEAGLFRMAFQIAGAMGFVAMGLYNVFTARISAALEAQDVYRVAKLSRAATRLACLITFPPVVVLLVAAKPLLGLIGPEFVNAAPLLQILLISQAIYVATGPAGLVLAMTGHERLNFVISASVTGVLLIVAPAAAHLFGLLGLTLAMAMVPIAGNIANLVTVLRLERINVLLGTYDPLPDDEEPHPGSAPDPEEAAEAASSAGLDGSAGH